MNDLAKSPFALIGVNSDEDLEEIRKIVKEKELNWRSFQNQPEGASTSIAKAWAVSGWPTVVVIDADFKIRHRSHDGEAAGDLVRQLVAELEAKKPQEKKASDESIEGLKEAFEVSTLDRKAKYEAFKPRFEAFAQAHEGSSQGLEAELWLFQQTWWEREAGTMEASARARLEHILATYPQEKALARVPESYYVLAKGDRAELYAKIAFLSEHDEVKAACLYGVAVYGPKEEMAPRLTALKESYGNLKWKHATYADLADARLAPHSAKTLEIGQVAPEIMGTDAFGRAMKLSDFRGQVVLLDFWGDW